MALQTAQRAFDSPEGDPFTLLNVFDEWSAFKSGSAGGDRGRGRRGSRGKGMSSRSWCNRRGLVEQRLYETSKLVRHFRNVLVDSGLQGEQHDAGSSILVFVTHVTRCGLLFVAGPAKARSERAQLPREERARLAREKRALEARSGGGGHSSRKKVLTLGALWNDVRVTPRWGCVRRQVYSSLCVTHACMQQTGLEGDDGVGGEDDDEDADAQAASDRHHLDFGTNNTAHPATASRAHAQVLLLVCDVRVAELSMDVDAIAAASSRSLQRRQMTLLKVIVSRAMAGNVKVTPTLLCARLQFIIASGQFPHLAVPDADNLNRRLAEKVSLLRRRLCVAPPTPLTMLPSMLGRHSIPNFAPL